VSRRLTVNKEIPLTVVYAVSRSFIPYLRVSLASVPRNIIAVIAFMGETDETGVDELPRPVEWFHIRETERFNRSKALNAAITHVRTPRVMIADADMIFPNVLFSTLDPQVETNTVIRFFIARFSAEHTKRILAEEDPWKVALYSGVEFPSSDKGPQSPMGDIIRIYASNNPCVYDTQFLRGLGCYDESFDTWGGEDEELNFRGLAKGSKELRLPIIVGHLHHEFFRDFKVPWKA
jgi:hypothetical protein